MSQSTQLFRRVNETSEMRLTICPVLSSPVQIHWMSKVNPAYRMVVAAITITDDVIAGSARLCPDESYFSVPGDNRLRYGWYQSATRVFTDTTASIQFIRPDAGYFTTVWFNGVPLGRIDNSHDAENIFALPLLPAGWWLVTAATNRKIFFYRLPG